MKPNPLKILLAAATALLGLTSPLTLHGQSTYSDTNLVLHYDFDEDFSTGEVLDMSGNENNGWRFDPTNWISATNGIFGSTAAQFTYAGYLSNDYPHVYHFSQYIGITNLTGFQYLTNGTISVWARFDTNNDRGIYLLDCGYDVSYAGSQASNSWTLGRQFTPYLSFTVYPAGGGTRTTVRWPNDTVRSGGTLPEDLSTTSFHLYTLTFDCPNDQAIAFYDGAPYMSNTIGLPWIRVFGCSSQPWLCVGAMAHNGTPQWGDDKYPNAAFFVGKMDDLRIYNRTLNPAEVQTLYAGNTFVKGLTIQAPDPDTLTVSWNGKLGAMYQVECNTDLSTNAWSPLGFPVTGVDGINAISESPLLDVARFYRVRVMP